MTIKYKCLYEITGRIEDVNTFLVPLRALPKESATQHWSDCAVHSEPAYPNGECDCGGYEPVAIIHRNEYNEYRLEPHDSFDIKSIPLNVDVPLFKSQQHSQVTDGMVVTAARALNKSHCQAFNIDEEDSWKVCGNDYLHDMRIALNAAHGIKG